MAIKYSNKTIVICDDCGDFIVIDKWQDASKLGWAVPCDGAFQRCPECKKKYTDKIFQEAKLAEIANKCPLVNKDESANQ